MRGKTYGGRPGQRVEEQGTWASRTRKHSEAGYGRPVDRGLWTAKMVKRPRQQAAHPQYANYWAPLTRKRLIPPHSAQPRHTNYWAPRTGKRHQQEHRPQRPTESSDRAQHAKGRTGDCPGPRKGTTTMSHRRWPGCHMCLTPPLFRACFRTSPHLGQTLAPLATHHLLFVALCCQPQDLCWWLLIRSCNRSLAAVHLRIESAQMGPNRGHSFYRAPLASCAAS